MTGPSVQALRWGTSRIPGGGEVELEALRFGAGEPRRVLVSGLHGDEPTPVFILAALVKRHLFEVHGTVDVVPAVNWAGLLLGRRRYPFGDVDLNRALMDAMPNPYARETMEDLVTFCAGAQLVVDLHSWDSPTALMGICHHPDCKMPDIRLQALARLGCEFIWTMQDAPEVDGTLGAALGRAGTPYCGVEFSPAWIIDDRYVEQAAAGLLNILREAPVHDLPPMGRRASVRCNAAGLFHPCVRPGDRIRHGRSCGDIINPRTLDVVGCATSPVDGMVLQLEARRSVFPGQIVTFVGTEDHTEAADP